MVTAGQLHLAMGCSGLVGEKLSPILSAPSWEPAASLCLPSRSVSPASLPIPVPSDRLWSSRWEVGQHSISGAGGLLAGLSGLLQVLKLARVRVKQVKGRSHLKKKKKRMGGKKEWEKGLRQFVYQRWLERWCSQV